MKYKRIYIEITNKCNLNCSFCSKTNKPSKEMTPKEFEEVLRKISSYTDYIYLHVKGEPLTHTHLEEILSLTEKYHKKVCLTTNGTLLKEKINILSKYQNLYQLNISLHSENKKKNYLEDILEAISYLPNTNINFRFWTLEKTSDITNNKYLEKIKQTYHQEHFFDKQRLSTKTYLSLDTKFDWPTLDSSYYNPIGTCLGGKTQLAVLSDGTISVCCLDANGHSNLGNIYQNTLEEIITSSKYQNILKGLNDHKPYLEICKHCSYKERFSKKNNNKSQI